VREQNESVKIRRLPDGDIHLSRIENREGPRLRLTTPLEANGPDFEAGALVEVQCEEVLYLGEVLGREDCVMIIAIEHAVDLAALAAIQNVWQVPPGG